MKKENRALEKQLEDDSNLVTLTYLHGRGRAEQARMMLAATNVHFKNKCLDTSEEMEALRAAGDLSFNQLPLLEIDGLKIVQSQTINRYLARRGGLYGTNDIEAMQCDTIADGVGDFMVGWLGYPFSSDKKQFLKENSQGGINKYAPRLESLVASNKDSQYSVGKQLTYADVLLADVCTNYTELLGEEWITLFPKMKAIRDMVCSLPSVRKYLESDQRHPFPHGKIGEVYRANVNTVFGSVPSY